MSKIDGWVHYLPSILKEGRLTHYFSPEFLEGEGAEEKMKGAIEKDPYEKQLKSLKDDRGNIWKINFSPILTGTSLEIESLR